MGMDPISKRYHDAGATPITARLTWDASNQRKMLRPSKRWQPANRDNCLQEHVCDIHNCVCLLTGTPSDLVVVDLDTDKTNKLSGVKEWCNKASTSDMQCPTVLTPSGGMHLYYSLSKSVAAGLTATKSATDVSLEPRELPTSIDIRAEGGIIIAPPTKYERGEYMWQQHGVDFTTVAELPALPQWFVDILNMRGEQGRSTSTVMRVSPMQMESVQLQAKPLVESFIQNVMTRTYNRDNGFDFDVADRSKPCVCGATHASNMYCVRFVLSECFTLRNYSQQCYNTMLGWERQPLLREVLTFPATDEVYVSMYQKTSQKLGKDIVFGNNGFGFYFFNGLLWEKLNPTTVAHDIRDMAIYVMKETSKGFAGLLQHAQEVWRRSKVTVQAAIHAEDTVVQASATKAAEEAEQNVRLFEKHLKALTVGETYIRRSRNIKGVVAAAEYMLEDRHLHRLMDADPDILGTNSGVLGLRTGILLGGKHYVSMAVEADWTGMDADTSQIHKFFMDLFGGDEEAVKYMQTVLGYGLTGRVDNDILLVCYGVGSNGKSATMKLLTELMGPYAGGMSKDCIIKADRSPSAGAASSHLAKLHKLRVAVCEETDETSRLDRGTIKQMTGGSRITARHLYQEPFDFTPTHLPILVTNHLPQWNADDAAMARRLLLVPFNTRFVPEHLYDATNPHHKLVDHSVRMWVGSTEAKEQMLVWMVKGAARWYAEGLGAPPPLFAQATASYMQDNDLLGNFIATECVKGPAMMIESKTLLAAFNDANPDSTMTPKQLKAKMENRGFVYKQFRGPSGKGYYFLGLAFKNT